MMLGLLLLAWMIIFVPLMATQLNECETGMTTFISNSGGNSDCYERLGPFAECHDDTFAYTCSCQEGYAVQQQNESANRFALAAVYRPGVTGSHLDGLSYEHHIEPMSDMLMRWIPGGIQFDGDGRVIQEQGSSIFRENHSSVAASDIALFKAQAGTLARAFGPRFDATVAACAQQLNLTDELCAALTLHNTLQMGAVEEVGVDGAAGQPVCCNPQPGCASLATRSFYITDSGECAHAANQTQRDLQWVTSSDVCNLVADQCGNFPRDSPGCCVVPPGTLHSSNRTATVHDLSDIFSTACSNATVPMSKCRDVNECARTPGICESDLDPSRVCVNTNGGHHCDCPTGHVDENGICVSDPAHPGEPADGGTAVDADVDLRCVRTAVPTFSPTTSPSKSPTTSLPTASPTESPTTFSPTQSPSASPTMSPTRSPSASPTRSPTMSPTGSPSTSPTVSPTTSTPTRSPTTSPTTSSPTYSPTTSSPTVSPISPTMAPTTRPTTVAERLAQEELEHCQIIAVDLSRWTNGPNGIGCGLGRAIDRDRDDQHYDCDCTGTAFDGENCDVAAWLPMGGYAICSADQVFVYSRQDGTPLSTLPGHSGVPEGSTSSPTTLSQPESQATLTTSTPATLDHTQSTSTSAPSMDRRGYCHVCLNGYPSSDNGTCIFPCPTGCVCESQGADMLEVLLARKVLISCDELTEASVSSLPVPNSTGSAEDITLTFNTMDDCSLLANVSERKVGTVQIHHDGVDECAIRNDTGGSPPESPPLTEIRAAQICSLPQELRCDIQVKVAVCNSSNCGTADILPCGAGSFGLVDGSSNCRLCERGGFYSDREGTIGSNAHCACQHCNEGQYSEGNGATSPMDCRVCPEGTNTSGHAGYRACKCLANHWRWDRFGKCESCEADLGVHCTHDCKELRPGFYWHFSDPIRGEQHQSFCQNLREEDLYDRRNFLADSRPGNAYACLTGARCLGGSSSSCEVGTTGPLCAICADEFYPWNGSCQSCPSGSSAIVKSVFLALLALLLIVAFVYTFVRLNVDDTRDSYDDVVNAAGSQLSTASPDGMVSLQSRTKKHRWYDPMTILAIHFTFIQIQSTTTEVYTQVPWPESVLQFRAVTLWSVSAPFNVFMPHCINHQVNSHSLYFEYWLCFGSLTVLLLLLLMYYHGTPRTHDAPSVPGKGWDNSIGNVRHYYSLLCASKKAKAKNDYYEIKDPLRFKAMCIATGVQLIGIFSPMITVASVQLLAPCTELCTETDHLGTAGTCDQYLTTDYGIDCTEEHYDRMVIVGYATFTIVGLLFPAFPTVHMMLGRRENLCWIQHLADPSAVPKPKDQSAGEEERQDPWLHAFHYLFSQYDGRDEGIFYVWASVDAYLVLFLTTIPLLIYPGTMVQLFAGTLFALIGMLLQIKLSPHRRSVENVFKATAASVQFITIFVGWWLRVNEVDQSGMPGSSEGATALLLGAEAIVHVFALVLYVKALLPHIVEWRKRRALRGNDPESSEGAHTTVVDNTLFDRGFNQGSVIQRKNSVMSVTSFGYLAVQENETDVGAGSMFRSLSSATGKGPSHFYPPGKLEDRVTDATTTNREADIATKRQAASTAALPEVQQTTVDTDSDQTLQDAALRKAELDRQWVEPSLTLEQLLKEEELERQAETEAAN